MVIKKKVMIIRVVLCENGPKKGMEVEQKMNGDWSILEEIGVLETLKQRAHDKLNKKFDIGGKNGRTKDL